MNKKKILLCLLSIPVLLLGVGTGSLSTTQDKVITPLDNLANLIHYTNPKLPDVVTYHIASAIITEVPKKYRCTIAAIAAVESDFTPSAVGDGGSSRGMFQVQPKDYGSVSTNVYKQTRQALNVFVSKGYSRARYNGGGIKAKKYEKKVYKVERRISNIIKYT